ncbi:MAG: hypothetical protein IPI73_17640 [Betaproteobacteria bacterium]|nr:hypothetical protein [Betaproteobacteria bacterium]
MHPLEPREAKPLRRTKCLDQFFRSDIAAPDVPHAPRADHRGETIQRFFDGSRPVRPVGEVEGHILEAQPVEACLQFPLDVRAIEPRPVRTVGRRRSNLRRDANVLGQVTRTLAKPLANRALAFAAGVAFRRIEHIDAKSERLVKRGERRVPVETAANQIPNPADSPESAAAEECPRNRDAGCAERLVSQCPPP